MPLRQSGRGSVVGLDPDSKEEAIACPRGHRLHPAELFGDGDDLADLGGHRTQNPTQRRGSAAIRHGLPPTPAQRNLATRRSKTSKVSGTLIIADTIESF